MNQVIKGCIARGCEFEKEKNIDSLIQSLQILSATDDLSVFDTGSFEAAEFYTLLHDLLTHQFTESELVRCILCVLQKAVRNPSVRSALVHNYHFIHPLTTLLDAQITTERKSQILRLIQELSYGVIICWQEAHLPKLIGILLNLITCDDSELIPIALGVMVNLCHNNKPAIYTLRNCIDIKAFLRTILNLQRENVETSVQVCKLLMVLNQLTGNVPDEEILSFVRVSFVRLNNAFNGANPFLMRHIVDFFRDAKESEHGRKVLFTYPKYEKETDNLINTLSVVEVPNNWQCVQQLLLFIQQLVDLELTAIIPLFPRLAHCILPWVHVEGVAPAALQLLCTMLGQCRNREENIYKAVCSSIESRLQMLVELLHNGCRAESITSGVQASISSLLHLFCELAANSSLCASIASAVEKEELKKLLLPLMSLNNHDGSHLFQQPHVALYVAVLSFIYQLSMEDGEWLILYSDLLQKKPILKALAVALYSGSYEVKKQILCLAGTRIFSKECLTVFSKYLTDLNQLFPFASNTTSHNPDKSVPCPQSQLDFSPSFTKTHRESLDGLVEKLNDLYGKNQIENASLASIIELYSYKLAEMRRSEQWLQSSLAAADSHRTQLSQRVAQLTGETGRLHQLLYSSQQTMEGSQMELTELRGKLHLAQESASSSHIKLKQLKQDVQSKGLILKDQSEEIFKMKQTIEDHVRKYNELKDKAENLTEIREEQTIIIQKLDQKSKELEDDIEELRKTQHKLKSEKSDLQTAHTKLEEKLATREKLILEKEVLVENKVIQIQSLEQEIVNHQIRIKGLEKAVKEKEKEISTQKTQLVDLERMRRIIFEISGGGKKGNS